MRLRMFLQYKTITHDIAKCFVAPAQPPEQAARLPVIGVKVFYGNCKELVILALFVLGHGGLTASRADELYNKALRFRCGRHIWRDDRLPS